MNKYLSPVSRENTSAIERLSVLFEGQKVIHLVFRLAAETNGLDRAECESLASLMEFLNYEMDACIDALYDAADPSSDMS